MHRVPSAAVLVAVAMSAAVGCVSVSPRPLAPGGPGGPRAVQGPARESLTVTGPGASRPPSPDGRPAPGVDGAPGPTADPFRTGPYDPYAPKNPADPKDPKDPADPTMPWDPPGPSRAAGGDQGARRSPDAPSLVAPPPATDPGGAWRAPSPERRAERQEPAPAPPEPERPAPRPAPEPEERHAAPAPAPAPASRGQQQGKGLCALGDSYGKWEKGGDASRICHQVYGR
ncbi:hypothetical protein [Streptomyces sp. NPDC037389]|uniref:hypothetical protein n=1 Tax=Streptomyces sp. NPDC037389 TaxID=3155369 RepID=UPI0033D826AC